MSQLTVFSLLEELDMEALCPLISLYYVQMYFLILSEMLKNKKVIVISITKMAPNITHLYFCR